MLGPTPVLSLTRRLYARVHLVRTCRPGPTMAGSTSSGERCTSPLLAAQQSVSRGAPALEGELYKTPQSTQWQPHQRYDVATYVRLTTADQTSVDVRLSAERRHLGGALGLSSAGMRSNTWRRTGEHAPAVTTLRAVPPRTPPPPEPVSEGFRATPRSEAVRGQLVSPGSLPIATDA